MTKTKVLVSGGMRGGRRARFVGATLALLFAGAVPASGQEASGSGQAGSATGVAAAAAETPEELMRRPVPGRVAEPDYFRRAVERGWRTEDGRPGPNYWTQGARYTLEARLDPETGRLDGRVRILWAHNAPARLPTVRLHLHQNLHAPGVARNGAQEVTGGVELRSVAVDSEPLSEGDLRDGPAYRVDGTLMTIRPSLPVEQGDTLEVEVEWSVTVPQNGAGRMGHSDREMYFLAYWFPKMAVFDDLRGWDAEPYLGSAEFYDDFADYEASLQVPNGWTVMATGELENGEEVYTARTLGRLAEAGTADGRVEIATPEDRRAGSVTVEDPSGWLTYRFRARRVRDFAWTASNVQRWDATSALVPDRDGDGAEERVLIHSFWREERAPLWEDQWLYGKQSIEHHSRYTGFPYPWPHMTSVEGADIIGGGMEFPMLTLIGPYDGSTAQALFNVTSHEIAHMWVPMIVGSNEKRHAWMDEGSTTFLEDESRMEYWPGVDHHRVEAQTYYQVASAGLEQSMMRHGDWYEPGPGYGVASYSKPATLMAALRDLLGRETWEEAYRAFIAEWAFKHPSPWDFFNTFERFAGRDLDWFWTSFYFETWTMDHAVLSVDPHTGGGATVLIQDVGRAPYPAVVRIRTSSGREIEETVPVEYWLQGHTTAEIEVPAEAGTVTRVEVDPGGHEPDADRSNNIWPRG